MNKAKNKKPYPKFPDLIRKLKSVRLSPPSKKPLGPGLLFF